MRYVFYIMLKVYMWPLEVRRPCVENLLYLIFQDASKLLPVCFIHVGIFCNLSE